MRLWLWLALFAGGLPACSSAVETMDEPGAETATCDALRGDAPNPVTIRIENRTTGPILIPNSCELWTPGTETTNGPDDVRVDDQMVLDPWYAYSCDDVLAALAGVGECLALDCFGAGPLRIDAGASYETTWSGLLLEEEAIEVPDACQPTCGAGPCRRRVAAAPGVHTLSVSYYFDEAPGAQPHEIEVPFTLPATSVHAVIDP